MTEAEKDPKKILEQEKAAEEAIKRIKTRIQDFTAAYRAGDAAALWNSFFLEESYHMPPGQGELKGDGGIKYFADLMAAGTKKMKWEVTEVSVRGDWATETGTYAFLDGNMSETAKGDTYDTWQKNEKTGEWYIYSGMWQEKLQTH